MLMNNFIITAKQIIMLCSKFTQLEMLVKIAHCSQVMARLEDTEKRHNTHIWYVPYAYAYTVRVWYGKSHRMRMVCTIRVWYVPYAYGTYHTRTVQNTLMV